MIRPRGLQKRPKFLGGFVATLPPTLTICVREGGGEVRGRVREREGEGKVKEGKGREVKGRAGCCCIAAMQRGLRVQKRMMHERRG